jgi:nitrogenase molybdenum-iron protein beta chain
MLLRHTKKEIKEREALLVNPAKTCQPVGAMYASLGIHKCFPHSHGSQGCCAYHRSALSRHYREPVISGTSSFTEGSSVFGGQANLLEAINNIFTIYDPDVIAIHTTCLSETIGDDIPQIVNKARDEGKVPEGKYVIHVNTPSYVGSHVTGFANMVKSMVTYFAQNSGAKKNQVNIIPGFVEPSDMREIKRIAFEMGVKTVMFPDTSGVLDSPQTGNYQMYPKGGVQIKALKTIGDSIGTIALGQLASGPAAKALDAKCKVKCEILSLPIGISATDKFVDALRKMAGVSVPESIDEERGQLIDMLTDMHQYLFNKKVALFGDPDHLLSLIEFLSDIGMKPVHIVTGTPGNKFETRAREILKDKVPNANIRVCGDVFLLHQWIKNEPVDLLIGNTYGKYIARDENIPFIRAGFPIFDRVGHSYFPIVGYHGAMRLVERILNVFMDRQDRDCSEEKMELVM